MLTIYSDDHHLHHGRCELMDGQLMPCFEMPSRADHVLQRVQYRESRPGRSAAGFRPRPDRAHPQPRLPRLLQRCLGTLDRIQYRRRLAALHLAGPHPAPDHAHQPARPTRLLQLRRRRTDYRRHLASGVQRGASRADRASRQSSAAPAVPSPCAVHRDTTPPAI